MLIIPALKYKPGMQIGPNNLLLLDKKGNNYKLFIIKYNDNLLEKLEELING